MRSRLAAVALVVSALYAAPASAQTHFTFVNGGSVTSFGYSVGPYNGLEKFGTTNQSVILDCVDFMHHVYNTQQWDANLTSLSQTSAAFGAQSNTRSTSLDLYKQAAYLSAQYSTAVNPTITANDIGNIQATIWNLFQPGTIGSGSFNTTGVTHVASYWLSIAQANYASFNTTGYYVVSDVNKTNVPHCGETGYPACSVQEFIMYNPSVGGSGGTTASPEPASFVLLGTGLLGIGMVRRRRKTAA